MLQLGLGLGLGPGNGLHTATVANCRLSLSTAWHVIHGSYLRHLEPEIGSAAHQVWIEAEYLPPSVFSLPTFNPCIHAVGTHARSTQLLGYPYYIKCVCSSCFSWLSFISVTFQTHLGACWVSICTKIGLHVAWGYHIKLQCQKHAKQCMTDIDNI